MGKGLGWARTESEMCCVWLAVVLSSRSDEMGVSYEAISTSNRTVQRGSRFASRGSMTVVD